MARRDSNYQYHYETKVCGKIRNPGIEGAIDIALQYPHRINRSDKALKELIDRVVKEEDQNRYKVKRCNLLS